MANVLPPAPFHWAMWCTLLSKTVEALMQDLEQLDQLSSNYSAASATLADYREELAKHDAELALWRLTMRQTAETPKRLERASDG